MVRLINYFLVSASSGEDDKITNRRRLILYSAFAWGIPLIIVIICSALALTGTVDTGYHGYGNLLRCNEMYHVARFSVLWLLLRNIQIFLGRGSFD